MKWERLRGKNRKEMRAVEEKIGKAINSFAQEIQNFAQEKNSEN